ncbi:hypothetical protein [Nocardia sp. NPDC002869]|uniref:hypothetical protein n=1 Tax=Nocardia sp. NPDC002869 TaxID=3161032 RepID=UPI00398CD949
MGTFRRPPRRSRPRYASQFLTSAAGRMTAAAIDLDGRDTKRYPDIVARIADMAGDNSAP